jgi:hypothetical protein
MQFRACEASGTGDETHLTGWTLRVSVRKKYEDDPRSQCPRSVGGLNYFQELFPEVTGDGRGNRKSHRSGIKPEVLDALFPAISFQFDSFLWIASGRAR